MVLKLHVLFNRFECRMSYIEFTNNDCFHPLGEAVVITFGVLKGEAPFGSFGIFSALACQCGSENSLMS